MAEAELVQVSADGQNGEEQQPINKDAQSSVRVKSKSKLKTLSPDRKAKKMEDYEWPKKSYFETRCLLDGETSGRMKNLVHRLVYIGKLRDNVGDRMDTSSDMITEVMKDIMHEQRTEDGFLEDAKILIISHDIPSRLYQQWNFRTLDIQAARMESYESSEGADRIILDMLGQLLKLGNKLAITPKVSFKTTLDQLHEKFPDLLPQQEMVWPLPTKLFPYN
ncbi:TEX47-like protein [Mya arenaria]|uniref:TEX47-like protein n=1 Tax=Mya arenaria TaxID=6604 RepID=A0ABY7DGT0_MYAAR|nr:TEX47-like protein [Mya arenaria]